MLCRSRQNILCWSLAVVIFVQIECIVLVIRLLTAILDFIKYVFDCISMIIVSITSGGVSHICSVVQLKCIAFTDLKQLGILSAFVNYYNMHI